MLSNRLVSPSLRLKVYLPAISETALHKRDASSQDFHHKRGPGGRSSFNGVVATVFGATGFLGRYVVNRLGRVGTQVIVPFRGDEHDTRHLRLMGDLGQIMFFDYNLKDPESVAKVMTHSNVVINLIGKNFPTRNFSFEQCHVDGARTIAKAAKQAGVKRLIHVSCLNAAEDSDSEFVWSKARGEHVVRAEFPEATILRPAQFYGHEDKYFNYYAYLRNLPFGIPLIDMGFSTTKRPVHVVDVAKAVVNSTFDESVAGKTFELSGPEEYYLYDIVDYIFKVMHRPFKPYKMPRQLYNLVAYAGEFSIFDPRITRDMLYRFVEVKIDNTRTQWIWKQFLCEKLNKDFPGFEELGIKPSSIDEEAISVLRRHRETYHFEEAVDEVEPCKATSTYQAA